MTFKRSSCCFVLAAGMLFGAENGYNLFQKGLAKERAEADPRAAIKIYEQVVRQNAKDHKLAAQALIRLGECYERLGEAGSRKAYEQIVRDYADQKEAVALARTRLGATPETGITEKQVWAGTDVNLEGVPSADGRYLPYVDWNSMDAPGSLAVRDLVANESRILVRDPYVANVSSGGFAESPVASPDGKQVAYAWYSTGIHRLRVIGMDGSGMRELVADKSLPLYPAAWSPDGKQIAALSHPGDGIWQILLVPAVGGPRRVLKTLDWSDVGLRGFSPDGRFLLYRLPKTAKGDGGIFAIAVDGSREAMLTSGSDSRPLWFPDGGRVLFISERSGTRALWSIRVVDGKPLGEPELVYSQIANRGMKAITRDGSLLTNREDNLQDVYLADFDLAAAKVTSEAKRLSSAFIGHNGRPVAWAPDGERLAFIRRKPGVNHPALVIRDLRSGQEKEIPLETLPSYGPFHIEWFPDGQSLFVPGTQDGQLRVDARTGEKQVLFKQQVFPNVALSHDGGTIYYSAVEPPTGVQDEGDQRTLRLIKRDIKTGTEQELYREKASGTSFWNMSLSPDGSQIAFGVSRENTRTGRTILVIPSNGGQPRQIYKGAFGILSGSTWTKDGNYVTALLPGDGQPGSKPAMALIPVAGGEVRRIEGVGTSCLSPDGSRIAIVRSSTWGEVWVTKNLLNASKPR